MVDAEQELYRIHREGQDKRAYFLLAAAGAAIGFALSQTKGAALAMTHAPLGAALLAWGLSFYFGCHRLSMVTATQYVNSQLLLVRRGAHPHIGTDPMRRVAAAQSLENAFERDAKRAERASTLQFRLLIAGAVLYIAWHILEMALRRGA